MGENVLPSNSKAPTASRMIPPRRLPAVRRTGDRQQAAIDFAIGNALTENSEQATVSIDVKEPACSGILGDSDEPGKSRNSGLADFKRTVAPAAFRQAAQRLDGNRLGSPARLLGDALVDGVSR